MKWTKLLEGQAAAAYHAARGLIDLVDEGALDWRPETGHNWLSVGQLLRHISNACGNTTHGFVTGKWMEGDHGISPDWKPGEDHQMPPAEAYLSCSKADALAALDTDEQTFKAMLTQAGEEKLETARSVAPWGGPERCLGEHFISCITHLDSHRTQLFYYLKLQGKPVHTGTLWGM